MDFRNNITAQNSRGLRNNNPLNLRPNGFTYQGQTGVDNGGHAIFLDVYYGIRAGTLQLYTDYFKHGLKTFFEIISKFAPASDGNNVNAYVAALKQATGIGNGDIALSNSNIETIIKAFIGVEIGSQYANMISNQDVLKGINAANKTGLTVVAATGGGFIIVVIAVLLFAIKKKKGK